MFIPSDSWTALSGSISPAQHEHSSPTCSSQLAGLPLCNSHLIGLQSWYWAQAAALAQAQRTMAEDQWMSDAVGVEAHGPYLGLDDPASDQYPLEAPTQSNYDYIQPLFENGLWSRAPYAETQLLTPPRPPPALPYNGPSVPGLLSGSAAPHPNAYVPPWDQTQALTGPCYRMDVEDIEKREHVSATAPQRPSFMGHRGTASPDDLRFAPSLSPDLAASPPPSPGAAARLETPGRPPQPRRSPRHPSPARRRGLRRPTPEAPERVAAAPRPANRGAMDEFLVRSRLAGKSYREIRRLGGFAEAESTLRGRFRALTKRKEERVRRPEWSDVDIKLLRKAVRKLGRGKGPAWLKKIAWKEVAEYIVDNGGTYRFGNATCRKKWDELVEAEGHFGVIQGNMEGTE